MLKPKLKIVRLDIDPELHQSFKLRCVADGISMKEKIIEMMTRYATNQQD